MSAYTRVSERCTAHGQEQWLLWIQWLHERLFCEHPSRKHLLESRLAKGLAGKLSSCWSLPPAVLLRTQAFLRKGGRTVKGGRQAKHHHSSHTPADQCAAGHHLSLQGVARQKTALAVQAFLHQSRTGTCFPPCLLEYTDAGACTVWQGELRGRLRRGEGGEPDTGARSPPRALYSTRFALQGKGQAPHGSQASVQCTEQSIAAEQHTLFPRSRQARSEPRQQLQLKASRWVTGSDFVTSAQIVLRRGDARTPCLAAGLPLTGLPQLSYAALRTQGWFAACPRVGCAEITLTRRAGSMKTLFLPLLLAAIVCLLSPASCSSKPGAVHD